MCADETVRGCPCSAPGEAHAARVPFSALLLGPSESGSFVVSVEGRKKKTEINWLVPGILGYFRLEMGWNRAFEFVVWDICEF